MRNKVSSPHHNAKSLYDLASYIGVITQGGSLMFGDCFGRLYPFPLKVHCVREHRKKLWYVNLLGEEMYGFGPRCPLCDEDYEHVSHLFLDCHYAHNVRKL